MMKRKSKRQAKRIKAILKQTEPNEKKKLKWNIVFNSIQMILVTCGFFSLFLSLFFFGYKTRVDNVFLRQALYKKRNGRW